MLAGPAGCCWGVVGKSWLSQLAQETRQHWTAGKAAQRLCWARGVWGPADYAQRVAGLPQLGAAVCHFAAGGSPSSAQDRGPQRLARRQRFKVSTVHALGLGTVGFDSLDSCSQLLRGLLADMQQDLACNFDRGVALAGSKQCALVNLMTEEGHNQ